LKPIAKGPFETWRMLKAIYEYNQTAGPDEQVYPFCADLTVHPVLVQHNMHVQVRLLDLPGLLIGALETNGDQLYERWDQLMADCTTFNDKPWAKPLKGIFDLNKEWYETDGGVWDHIPKYREMAREVIHGKK
jgi:hypothetical protein